MMAQVMNQGAPMLFKFGVIWCSQPPLGVMIKKIMGLINAIKVQAMVCMPSVLEKVSMLSPNKNENSNTKNGAVSNGNNIINRMYK